MSARAVSIAPQCGGQWSVRGRPILVNEHTELHSAINQRMTAYIQLLHLMLDLSLSPFPFSTVCYRIQQAVFPGMTDSWKLISAPCTARRKL